MVEIKNITKKYKENVGNFDININIKEGETYAIVGPNGAGKTTLIGQILGFIKSDSGEINVNGLSSWKNRQDIMKFTGYVAGEVSLYEEYTGLAFLKLVKQLKPETNWNFVVQLIKHFQIDTSTKIKKMSKGMKQKIAIIASVMNKPKFVVFDEPTSGLDPIMQEQFRILVKKLKENFKSTIIICSHIFQEVVELSDRVGVIKNGKLVKELDIKGKDVQKTIETFKAIFKDDRDTL
ncbi:ATP-binding cassette domain-containing protein [Spiroplasma endosymbiont of Anurida maritima]|uniref:ABC transporter ATP-binding protein n=1 Tax=Spiroplasma endosymbiont of Anurida maritima TaxID=2967972 RepID=UPI0036D3F86F